MKKINIADTKGIMLLMSSSKFFTSKKAVNLFSKPLTKAKIAYITTAANGEKDRGHIERCIKRMKKARYNFEEIDIEGKNKIQLNKLLKDKDVIYVAGGNTYHLLKAVKESGFDIVIKKLIKSGVAYAGSSAGAYIMCPTIEMAGWHLQDINHCKLKDLSAVNAAPFLVYAHYNPELKAVIQQRKKTSKYPIRILTDNQALWIGDKEVKFIGKEVKI